VLSYSAAMNLGRGWSSLVFTQPSTSHHLLCERTIAVYVCLCVFCIEITLAKDVVHMAVKRRPMGTYISILFLAL